MPSMPGSGSGSCGSSRSSSSTRSCATASALTQFRSAGTTCHGAHSVDVSVSASSYAARYSSKRFADLEVVAPELPALLRVVDPLLEPPPLLLLRDVEEDLHHRRPLVDEHPLPLADVAAAPAPDLLRGEAVHPDGDDVLVVRAVEDPDLAARRELRVHAPEVVMRELVRRRRLERRDPAPLRAHAPEDRADHAVLARGVEALQDEEDAAPALGVEAVLEDVDAVVQLVEQLLAAALVEAERVAGVALRDARGRRRARLAWGNPWFPRVPLLLVPGWGQATRGLPAGKAGLRLDRCSCSEGVQRP